MTRASWDETWAELARVIARRSRCSRARVGAVIVDSTNRIVATGYNGPPAAHPADWVADCDGSEGGLWCMRAKLGPKPETVLSYTDCPTIHAEANALSFCDRRDRIGGTIYVTGHTCANCAKLIANSGLARLVICDPDPNDEHRRNAWESYELLETCGIEVVR